MSSSIIGKFVAIEGTDGSGKGTQFKILCERLSALGIQFGTADFPRYKHPSAWFVEQYLGGNFGSLDTIGARKASYFYALDRYAASHDMWRDLREGKHLITNRYTTSSMAHQGAKIDDPKEREEFLDWLQNLEYVDLGIPKPDMVIFLHVAPHVGQKLVDQKEKRGHVDGKRDSHEQDLDHLRRASETYKLLSEKFGWTTINCMDGDNIKTPEAIHEMIFEKVKPLLGLK